jgi:hypothetical protein
MKKGFLTSVGILFSLIESGFSQTNENIGSFFSNNVSNKVETYVNFFPLGPAGKSVDDEAEAHSYITTELTEDLGDDARVYVEIVFAESTGEGAYNGTYSKIYNQKSQGKHADLSVIEYTYFGDKYDLIMGKTKIAMGASELYSATDVFNNSINVNPLHPKKIGKWQLGVEYFYEKNSLLALVLPVDEAIAGSPSGSRWNPDGNSDGGVSFPGLSLPSGSLISASYSGKNISNWGYLLKLNGVAEGADYFYGIYTGPGVFRVLKQASPSPSRQEFNSFRPLGLIVFAGYTRAIDALKYYGESLFQHSYNNEDDDFIRYSFGFKYRETNYANTLGLDEITPIVEIADEIVLRGYKNPNIYASSLASRPNPHNLMMAVEVAINAQQDIRLSYNYNLKDKDYSIGLGAEHTPNDNLSFFLNFYDFGGSSDTQFGQYRRNKNIELGLKSNF